MGIFFAKERPRGIEGCPIKNLRDLKGVGVNPD